MSSTTCEHNDELLTLGAMHLLSAEEQTRLDAQVSACPACQERLQEYRALAALMPQLMLLETAPANALNEKPVSSPNGKTPHLPALFARKAGSDAESEGAAGSNHPGLDHPIAIGTQPRAASHRLVKVVSVLAAAIMLLGLVGGFWLLALSRAPKTGHNQTPVQPTEQTVITYNPCSSEIAKGIQGGVPACGLVVMDYLQTPAALVEVDPATGNPQAGLKPLPVGNALLASLSADHRTLALGIIPNGTSDPTYLQMVWLDNWKLGAKLRLPINAAQNLQDMAITPDGTGIYAVIDDGSQTTTQAVLQYYTYDRGHDTLAFRWSKPLPFVPGNGVVSDGSFALSADAKTAYLFSAATNPPQLAAVPLNANGIGSPRILPLPSIASGAVPPFGDENYTYKPGDPIYQWYQPAVMFVPTQNKLYLVHAEAKDPSKDVLVVIDLAQMTLGPDIPIQNNASHALTSTSLPAQTSTSPAAALFSQQANPALSNGTLGIQPQVGLRPFKGKPYNGRSEVGAVSPDGRWIYLSGFTSAPTFNSTGSWSGEQQTGLGLLKIDTQTGKVVGRWYTGASYYALIFAPDGQDLYLFGPPPYTNTTDANNVDVMLVFDTQQAKVANVFSNIESGWFILTLP